MIQTLTDTALIETLFPFYFLADKKMCIVKTGKSMSRFVKENDNLQEVFLISNSSGKADFSWEALSSNPSRSYVLTLLHNPNKFSIKGQFVSLHEDGLLLFVGTPRVNSEEDIQKNQLQTNDFALHDDRIDLLHFISSYKIKHEELENANFNLNKSNQELLHLSRELETKNNELRKINSELDNFVYCVSHDLRSPLLSIKGLLALVFNAYDLNIDVNKYLRMAENSINRLDQTIQEILAYSRNARLAANYEWFDVKRLAVEVFNEIQLLNETAVQFTLDMPDETMIYSDKSRISVLLRNLFSNGVKFRRTEIADPGIRFSMQTDTNQYQFVVADNGIGMQEDILNRIFEMFYRGSSTLPGTGLGLYISKEVLNKLGGDISAVSSLGIGTSITFTLPIQQI